MEARKVIIRGKVQGVFYRAFVREQALALGLSGWVMNQPDGAVCLVAEGPPDRLDALLECCRRGPDRARVGDIETESVSFEGLKGFEIRR
jgi:acylphosphatase